MNLRDIDEVGTPFAPHATGDERQAYETYNERLLGQAAAQGSGLDLSGQGVEDPINVAAAQMRDVVV